MKTVQKGFTLIELVIVVAILGVVAIWMIPTFNSFITAQANAYDERMRMDNQLIGNGLRTYAETATTTGRLPAPYTGNGYISTILDPASTGQLKTALLNTGVNESEINDDGKAAANVRVYQLVQGLTQSVPLYAQSGALVTLTYDYGAIYMTACSKVNSSCNPSAASGVPGSSPALTTGNYSTWTTTGTDGAPYFVSSLTTQKEMLATTVQRLDRVRDALVGYLRAQQVTAPGNDNTNWYPNQAGTVGAGSMSGKNPATTQGCRDGWYDLSSASVLVLQAVGLASQEYGVTAWGGHIEYCRDYDALGTKAANAPPHYAAIRMLANVSSGGAPDGAIIGNNVILTF